MRAGVLIIATGAALALLAAPAQAQTAPTITSTLPAQARQRRGNRFIAWSLGNFVFDWNSPGADRTGILRLGLGSRGVVSRRFLRARINWVQPRLRRSSM